MAWAFLFIGMLFIISAWKDKQSDLFALLQEDFTGQDNFFFWVLAIIILVSIGTFKPIRPITDAFLGLIVLVIVIAPYKNGRDLFAEFTAQIKEGTS